MHWQIPGYWAACVVYCGPLDVASTGGLCCNAMLLGTGHLHLRIHARSWVTHARGISILGSAAGNVRLTAARTFNTTGVHNGSQITGNGLSSHNDLTIDNNPNCTIATNQVVVNGVLIKQGTFDIGSTKKSP
jgi:hypothetical protein